MVVSERASGYVIGGDRKSHSFESNEKCWKLFLFRSHVIALVVGGAVVTAPSMPLKAAIVFRCVKNSPVDASRALAHIPLFLLCVESRFIMCLVRSDPQSVCECVVDFVSFVAA